MQEYRFRSEYMHDVNEAKKIQPGWYSAMDFRSDARLPDVEVFLKSELSLQEIRNILSQVEDGHTMVESLNYADKYTGERYYDYEDY